MPEATPRPGVTIVIPSHDGLSLLKRTLPFCLNTRYAPAALSILVIDNGSRDGTASEVPALFPGVHVIDLDRNVGFAAACNHGARVVASAYVAFLNNDMKVDPDWLAPLVAALEESPERIAAGSKVLSWDGKTVDFAGGDLNFEGRAFQRGLGVSRDRAAYAAHDAIFLNGGAMLVRRDDFLRIGGFDEDFFAYYEDVDFGWRASILGFSMRWVPESVTYHQHGATAARLSRAQKRFLLERNALLSMYKNYDDADLPRALTGALLLAGLRAIAGAPIQRDAYLVWPPAPAQDSVSLTPEGGAHLAAVNAAIALFPSLRDRRAFIQENRRRTDREVLSMFGKPAEPIHPGRAYAEAQHAVLGGTGLARVLTGPVRRVLIVSPDVLPLDGLPTTGAGLRAWGIGQGLRSRGFEVSFSMPRAALASYPDVPESITDLAWDERNLPEVVHASGAEVVVACGWPLLEQLGDCARPVALDFHGPHLLERTIQGHLDPETNIRTKLACIARADFYTCAGDRQRSYFIPWLLMAGVPYRDDMIRQVPVSLSPEPPSRSSFRPGEPVFVYGGVFLPWQDPALALTVLVEELERAGTGRLELYGGRHPFIPLDTRRFEALVRRLESSTRVRAHGMVDHDHLLRAYGAATVAMDVMARNPERELAFTTRTVEYLWCGLPVIYNNYADLAHLIRQLDAGWVVNPNDAGEIRAAVRAAVTDEEHVRRKAENARRLVRERLSWDSAIEPLAAFCAQPAFRSRAVTLAGSSAAIETAALRRAVYDKDVHIRNLEAMLARQTPFTRARYYWGRVKHYYHRGGPSAIVSQSIDKIRYLRSAGRS
ncbi:MAG: glycosyltransferase [Candidatus Eisenbacteria bacterium]|nr:glycosyltransferase [Candidatus Eisenbacteria bacterium]